MKKIMVLLAFAVVFAGCTKTISQEGKYDCQVYTDCINSCQEGAVSADWYAENMSPDGDCLDGCNGPWSDAPQCIDSQCVSFSQGEQNPACTNQ